MIERDSPAATTWTALQQSPPLVPAVVGAGAPPQSQGGMLTLWPMAMSEGSVMAEFAVKIASIVVP